MSKVRLPAISLSCAALGLDLGLGRAGFMGASTETQAVAEVL